MIEYESSLRLPVLVVGAALVALVLAGSAHAAGGSPVPAPDDPPPGLQVTAAKKARDVPTPRATKETAPTTPPTQRATKATTPPTSASALVPTPDAPLAPTAAPKPAADSSGANGTETKRATPEASPSSRPSTPRVAVQSVAPAVVRAQRTVEPPVRTARSEPRPRPRKPAKPRQAKPLATRAAEVATPVVRLPHDAIRLGLPVGALIVGRPGSDPDAGLLVLAALLLVVAGAGTLVVGLAARGAVRHA